MARLSESRYCNESFQEYGNAGLVNETYPHLFANGLLCAGWLTWLIWPNRASPVLRIWSK